MHTEEFLFLFYFNQNVVICLNYKLNCMEIIFSGEFYSYPSTCVVISKISFISILNRFHEITIK